MSATTQNWSWVVGMNQNLYQQLRNLIFSKIITNIPSDFPYEYGGVTYTINSLYFNSALATVNVDPNQENVLILSTPFNGQVTSLGIMQNYNGRVTASIYLDNLEIKPQSPANSNGNGASWTNYLYLNSNTIQDLTVTTAPSSYQAMFTSFFQSSIDTYVASSPNSLGEQNAPNLNQYFAPTYQRFITLTSNPNDLRVLLLVMVNNVTPPSSNYQSFFESSSIYNIPGGADSVIAFDDYTLYKYFGQQLMGRNGISNVNVSQGSGSTSAVLTATVEKTARGKVYTGTLQAKIANNAFQTSINLSNAFKADFSYSMTVDLINNQDGSQAFEVENQMTGAQVSLNNSNQTVITLKAIYDTLKYMPPFFGCIFKTIMQAIQNSITRLLLKAGAAFVFDKTKEITGGNSGYVSVTYQGIKLNAGLILYANMSINANNPNASIPAAAVKISGPKLKPVRFGKGVDLLLRDLDAIYDGFKGKSVKKHPKECAEKV